MSCIDCDVLWQDQEKKPWHLPVPVFFIPLRPVTKIMYLSMDFAIPLYYSTDSHVENAALCTTVCIQSLNRIIHLGCCSTLIRKRPTRSYICSWMLWYKRVMMWWTNVWLCTGTFNFPISKNIHCPVHLILHGGGLKLSVVPFSKFLSLLRGSYVKRKGLLKVQPCMRKG